MSAEPAEETTGWPPVRRWYIVCVFVALVGLVVPFFWRTPASIFMMVFCCLSPFLLLITVAVSWRWLRKSRIGWRHYIFGVLIIFVAVFGFPGDSVARNLIFRYNYPTYRRVVQDILAEPPIGKQVPKTRLDGLGIYRGEYIKDGGVPEISLDTMSGPSLETVIFRPAPVQVSRLKGMWLVEKDDLGYWYFVGRK